MEEGGCLIETTELRTESGTLVSSHVYVFEDVVNKQVSRHFEGRVFCLKT